MSEEVKLLTVGQLESWRGGFLTDDEKKLLATITDLQAKLAEAENKLRPLEEEKPYLDQHVNYWKKEAETYKASDELRSRALIAARDERDEANQARRQTESKLAASAINVGRERAKNYALCKAAIVAGLWENQKVVNPALMDRALQDLCEATDALDALGGGEREGVKP